MNNFDCEVSHVIWVLFVFLAVVFNTFCNKQFSFVFNGKINPFLSITHKRLFHGSLVHYSTPSNVVFKLDFYSGRSVLEGSKRRYVKSHFDSEAGLSKLKSSSVLKRPKLVVDSKFAERLRLCQENDSLPLVNDIIVTEKRQFYEVFVIINSLNALSAYRGIINMNVDLFFGGRKYRNKLKVVKEHQIRLLKYIVHDLPTAGNFSLVDHATSSEYKSLPFRVVPLQPRKRIAICAYISSYNSVDEIKFFLAFYLIQKVDTVIFYCAESYDYFYKALEKEIENGYVILYNYPWPLSDEFERKQRSIQISQINSCYYRHRSFFEYIISIDVDEFMYSELLPDDLYQAITFSFKLSPPKDDIAVRLLFALVCRFSLFSIQGEQIVIFL